MSDSLPALDTKLKARTWSLKPKWIKSGTAKQVIALSRLSPDIQHGGWGKPEHFQLIPQISYEKGRYKSHGMVWVGGDLRDHLIPSPKPLTSEDKSYISMKQQWLTCTQPAPGNFLLPRGMAMGMRWPSRGPGAAGTSWLGLKRNWLCWAGANTGFFFLGLLMIFWVWKQVWVLADLTLVPETRAHKLERSQSMHKPSDSTLWINIFFSYIYSIQHSMNKYFLWILWINIFSLSQAFLLNTLQISAVGWRQWERESQRAEPESAIGRWQIDVLVLAAMKELKLQF